MKSKKILVVLLCILLLAGCNTGKAEKGDVNVNGDKGDKTKSILYPLDLNTEKGIKEYLIGEWIFDQEYSADVLCKMNIDENLNVHLLFHDKENNKDTEEFSGEIKFDRLYAEANEAPDLIVFELEDTDYPGGDFFFLHRTIYDKKRVMSLFFAGNGNSIFDYLGYEWIPEELVFEKETGEVSAISPIKGDNFYAVYWGKGGDKEQSLWLDDVTWTPKDEEDYAPVYPVEMTNYENDVKQSILYNIKPENISEILGDDLFPGEVFYVQTDEKGNITEFVNADYKRYLEEGYADPGTKQMVFDIFFNDIKEVEDYLDMGMDILFSKKTIDVNGEDCYPVTLGTNHDDMFVREIHYAVNIDTGKVYRDDVINDKWVLVN